MLCKMARGDLALFLFKIAILLTPQVVDVLNSALLVSVATQQSVGHIVLEDTAANALWPVLRGVGGLPLANQKRALNYS